MKKVTSLLKTSPIKTFSLNGELFDFGSDYHLPLDLPLLDSLLETLRQGRRAQTYFCLGDIFSTRQGQDSSQYINYFLERVCQIYDLVIYVPGNHDLRGRLHAWQSFRCQPNLIIPLGDEPRSINTGRNKILAGNLFYDLAYIDPAIIGIERQALRDFYASTNDGQFLLDSDFETFAAMTAALAERLTPGIDILLTHALPDPSLVRLRLADLKVSELSLYSRLSIPVIFDIEGDNRQAERVGASAELCRRWWNMRSLLMGSNLLGHPRADPKDGLVSIFGHNHRSTDKKVRSIRNNHVHFLSYQPYDELKREQEELRTQAAFS